MEPGVLWKSNQPPPLHTYSDVAFLMGEGHKDGLASQLLDSGLQLIKVITVIMVLFVALVRSRTRSFGNTEH